MTLKKPVFKGVSMEIKMSKGLKRVFDFMVEENGITSLDAFVELGESRLSARILS